MWRSTLNRPSRWLVCAVFLSSAVGVDALGQDGTGALEAGGAELALVPVGSSAPHVINGNEIIIPSVGGGTVELQIRAAGLQDLAAVCVLAYRAWIDSSGYSSGMVGSLDVAQIPCVTDDDCFRESACDEGVCDTRAAAFIDFVRPDAIFAGVLLGAEVDLTTPDFAYGATMFAEGCHRPDGGYCGTLILEVPDNAAGTFTIGFRPHPDTAVVDRDDQPILPLALTPALITITAPVCGNSFCELEEDVCSCPDDCGSPPSREDPRATCNDGLDNDCDGSIDAADTDCPSIPTVSAWGLAIMALLLLTVAKVRQRRPTARVTPFALFVILAPAGVALAQDESGASAASGSELALVPVGASAPHVINGNEITIPSGGATVELEIRGSGFYLKGGVCVLEYVAWIDSSGYSSGLSGNLTPAQIPCAIDAECMGGATCGDGVCDRRSAGFINQQRADYLFANKTHLTGIDVSTLDFGYGAIALGPSCPAQDSWYGGTLILDAPEIAAGTFTIGFQPYPRTVVRDDNNQSVARTLVPALITITATECGNGIVELGEACDGFDDAACPGACLSDCTCASCGNGTCDPIEDSCTCPGDCGSPPESEDPFETCKDRIDNDCDGSVDAADRDCPAIPTVSEWGLIIMALSLLTTARVRWRRRKSHVACAVGVLLFVPFSVALAQDGTGALEAGGAELALVPVGASAPHVINGNEITIPSVGATVELELRASSLQENGDVCIIGYGAQIDSSGYSSGIDGPLAPAQIPCNTNDDCFGEAGCEGDTCDARAAAYIDANSPDFLLAGLSGIIHVDLSMPDYRFGVIMFSCRHRDSGYCGTLILDVPDDASGTFTVGFHPDPETAIGDEFDNFISPLTLTPALISITATECGNGIVELGEDCDGIDDAACSGACLSDCTCASCGNGTCDPIEDSCTCSDDCGSPPESEVPLATCNDRIDNDCDGSFDAADPDCPAIPAVSAWGMASMALLLLTLAKLSRHRPTGRVTLVALFLIIAPAGVGLAQDKSGASAASGAELALVPVGSSAPHVINGNEITIPSGGATVELELRASSLQENGEVCIIGYGAQIDSAGYSSGIGGPLAPAQIPCNTNDDCFGEAGCEGDTCDARAAAFIDANRPDFLFAGLSGIILVDLSTSDYRFSVSMFSCRRGDSGYCGTLILDVPDDAAGTFTVGFHPDPETAVVDADFNFIPLTLMPALISITATECGNGIVELGEDCDGIDDAACPGACLSDCTCASCGNGTCDPIENSCTCSDDCGSPAASEVPLATCKDGVDNDCDGPIDSADLDCPAIPTVSEWGLIIMALLLLTLAKVCQRRATDRVTPVVLFLIVAPTGFALAHDESGASAASGAELALVPVGASSAHVINGNEIIIPSIGATVELEIRGSGFQKSGETCVSSYLAMIDSSGFTSGGNGALTLAEIPCLTDEDCVGESSCVDTVCDNRSAAFIDAGREDYLFILFPSLRVVDVFFADFSYSATMVFVGTCNARDSWYGGSLILDVPNNAAGSFTVGFRTHPDTTVNDEFRNPILPLSLTSALITVTPPECGNLICEFDEDERHCPLDCLEHEIPAVGEWGLVIMALLLLTVAKICRHCALDRPGKPA